MSVHVYVIYPQPSKSYVLSILPRHRIPRLRHSFVFANEAPKAPEAARARPRATKHIMDVFKTSAWTSSSQSPSISIIYIRPRATPILGFCPSFLSALRSPRKRNEDSPSTFGSLSGLGIEPAVDVIPITLAVSTVTHEDKFHCLLLEIS